VVFNSRHSLFTAQHFTIVNVNAQHKKKNYSTLAMTHSRNILTNRRISDNAVAVTVIVQLSEALRLCRNMSVSTGAY